LEYERKKGGKKRKMQIEIPDELADRIKGVLEFGVEKGYYSEVPADAGIEKILESLVAEDEKKLGLIPKKRVEDHNCAENMRYSSGFEITPTGVIARGECEKCGRGLVMTCVYQDTRDSHTDEVIDTAKNDEEGFIHADDWGKMTENDIISSIDVGLSVLDEKGFSKENNGQLLVLIEEIAKMLVREV